MVGDILQYDSETTEEPKEAREQWLEEQRKKYPEWSDEQILQYQNTKSLIERDLNLACKVEFQTAKGKPFMLDKLREEVTGFSEMYDGVKEELNGFVWDDTKVIQNKVFPMDYHKDFFYFGLMLPKMIDNVVKGKSYGKKQVYSHVLISSKGFLEVNETLKEKFSIQFGELPTIPQNRWELADIKNFLDKKTKGVNGEELFNKITQQYEKYLYINNKTWYKIHAVWDMGSYVYRLFEAYPLFELRGLKGTAKSQTMTISSYMTFNGGQVMANPSEATLFRETEETRGAKYIDEAEKLFIYNKITKQWEGDVRADLLNASYTKLAKVPRQEKLGNKFFTKWYSPYSPTMIGSINGLHGATEDRAITRITTKSPNDDSRGELDPAEDSKNPMWQEIRNECYRFALENWFEIYQEYANFPKDIGLKRRDYQIWKPLLCVSKFISTDLYKEILQFAQKTTTQKTGDTIPEGTFHHFLLKAFKLAIESSQSPKIYVEGIKQNYCRLRNDTDGLQDAYLNRSLSKKLDGLGFKEMRDNDRNGSYFEVGKECFDTIVLPLCPELAFLSSPSSPSSHLRVKEGEKCDDTVTIGDDKNKEDVTIVTIGDESDDSQEKESIEKPSISGEDKALEDAKKVLQKFPEKPSIASLKDEVGLDFHSAVAIRETWQEAYDLIKNAGNGDV